MSAPEVIEAQPEANGKAPEIPEATFPVDSFKEAATHLRRPFTPAAVKFKVQTTWEGGGLIVAYIDARLAVERLNLICPQLWSDTYSVIDTNTMWCHLTVDGITRHDVGEGQKKGLVSDALKRAAVKFGVGVSLYAIPQLRLKVNDGHLREGQKQGQMFLTPNGLTYCQNIYEAWLDTKGRQAFGEPLDHGDVDDAAGDSVETGEKAPADEPESPPTASPEPTPTITKALATKLFEAAKDTGLDGQRVSMYLTTKEIPHEAITSKATAIAALRTMTPEQAGTFEADLAAMRGH